MIEKPSGNKLNETVNVSLGSGIIAGQDFIYRIISLETVNGIQMFQIVTQDMYLFH